LQIALLSHSQEEESIVNQPVPEAEKESRESVPLHSFMESEQAKAPQQQLHEAVVWREHVTMK
jgi:hypothetical protein